MHSVADTGIHDDAAFCVNPIYRDKLERIASIMAKQHEPGRPFISTGTLVVGIVLTILVSDNSLLGVSKQNRTTPYLSGFPTFIFIIGITMIVLGLLGLLTPVLNKPFYKLTRAYRDSKKYRKTSPSAQQQQQAQQAEYETHKAQFVPMMPVDMPSAPAPQQQQQFRPMMPVDARQSAQQYQNPQPQTQPSTHPTQHTATIPNVPLPPRPDNQ